MNYAIEVKNVSHKFGDKRVCDNISINFEENKIYGLLGKNGTGKTTLINIIGNQLLCKEGEVRIFGKSLKEDVSALDDVCIVREREFFDPEYKIKDILKMHSYFYKGYDYKLENKLCNHFDIDIKKQYKKLSRGMKSLVSNIIGICSNAPITIFDEPTIGLDAVNRQEFYSILLDSYMENNRTIIISTHLIDEIDELLEKVVIIKDGEVKVDDDREVVMEKAHYISGKRDDLQRLSILKDEKPLKSFGNTETYSYYGDICNEDLKLIESLDINIENMSLQEMFINMNKRGDI